LLIPPGELRQQVSEALTAAGVKVTAEDEPVVVMRQLQCGDVDILLSAPGGVAPGVLDFALEAAELKPWLTVVFLMHDDQERRALASTPSAMLPNITLLMIPPDGDFASALTSCLQDISQQPSGELASVLRGRHREMSILTNTVESALKSGNVGEAMRDLASGLSRLFGAPLLAILEVEDEVPRFSVACRDWVPEEEIQTLERDLRERYWLIAGGALERPSERSVSRLRGGNMGQEERLRSLVVPFFTDDELRGCFGVAFPEGQSLAPEQLLFLEYVPTHLSTVFSGLRRVRFLAMHDALTGVYNRLYLEEHLKNRLAGHQRYGSDLSVVMLDLDNFKEINDNFGHPVGDRLLREFAELLLDVSRDADIVSRYGGDEFIVVLDNTTSEGACRFTLRLLEDTYSRTFASGIEGVDLSVSAGITTMGKAVPSELQTADRLLSQADAALYAAKAAGRNCGAVWPSMSVVSWVGGAEQTPSAKTQGEAPGTASVAAGKAVDEPPRLIVVDDQPEVLTVVSRVLERAGYAVDRAMGGEACLEFFKQPDASYDLVVTDLTMPGMDGLQLLKRIRHLSPHTAGIVLTGYATLENAVTSFQSGVRAFLRKPVDRMELLGSVENALRVQTLENENSRYREQLERMVLAKSSQLRQALAETRQAFEFAVDGFATLVDMRERSSGRHVLRVQAMSLILGKKMGLSSRHLERLARGAVLHDIGKVAVPDHILLKPGPLDDDEWDTMRSHAQIGYDILRKAPWLEDVAETVRSHHERYDGSGYPRGLVGEAICLEARVFAVVDSYDAMRVERVYRGAFPRDVAVREIVSGSGVLYDPKVVTVFEESVDELEEILDRFKGDAEGDA
jgi:diguanylate cyclase (GGDEF)-like protein/putative nucleotidyltransferase with HDIG domain